MPNTEADQLLDNCGSCAPAADHRDAKIIKGSLHVAPERSDVSVEERVKRRSIRTVAPDQRYPVSHGQASVDFSTAMGALNSTGEGKSPRAMREDDGPIVFAACAEAE